MALMTVSRLGAQKFLGRQILLIKPNLSPVISACASTSENVIDDHDLRNIKLNRPMSPHLSIYKFQMSSVLSISHRITGLMWSSYAIGIGGAALILPHDFTYYLSAVEAMQLGTPTILVAKFLLAFPMMYHTCNGVRHLMWDTGSYLNKNSVITTGSAMLAATLLTTGIAMFL